MVQYRGKNIELVEEGEGDCKIIVLKLDGKEICRIWDDCWYSMSFLLKVSDQYKVEEFWQKDKEYNIYFYKSVKATLDRGDDP